MGQPHPNVITKTTSYEIPPGFKTIDVIFSPTFTGTLAGAAYDGSVDAVQSFDGNGDQLGSIQLVVTTGSVRIATT